MNSWSCCLMWYSKAEAVGDDPKMPLDSQRKPVFLSMEPGKRKRVFTDLAWTKTST